MVASPAPLTVTSPFTTSAINGLDDAYVQAPDEVEVGGTKAKSGSLTTFCISAQGPMDGIPTTVSVIETGLGEA